MDKETLYEELIEYEIASADTLRVITGINGYTLETLNDVLYEVTGFRTWAQYMGEDD